MALKSQSIPIELTVVELTSDGTTRKLRYFAGLTIRSCIKLDVIKLSPRVCRIYFLPFRNVRILGNIFIEVRARTTLCWNYEDFQIRNFEGAEGEFVIFRKFGIL